MSVQLASFSVDKLFGEFDYRLPFNVDERITAIIAPNGSGKTICLRLINALFQGDWAFFEEVVFHKCTFVFTDASIIEVLQKREEIPGPKKYEAIAKTVVTFQTPGQKIVRWEPHMEGLSNLAIQRYLPWMARGPQNLWVDTTTENLFTFSEMLRVYRSHLPPHYLKRIRSEKNELIDNFISGMSCKLIETQRIYVFDDETEERYRSRTRQKPKIYAISKKAETLRKIISDEINKYAALSQSLDRSFPARVIASQGEQDNLDVSTALHELDVMREKLTNVGILEAEQDVAMGVPAGPLSPAIAKVLKVYIEDNREKLASLEDIYRKVELFTRLMTDRFGHKSVVVDTTSGISVKYAGKDVPIESLSSGEQHQLVLFFELLFQTKPNSLILIDEPEISLHVAWQRKFVSDLLKIIKLNQFDVVLATHSPQLIGHWSHLVVELGDVYEGDADEGRD